MATRRGAPFLSPTDRAFAGAVAELTYCNPFAPKRIELERAALGTRYVDDCSPWNLQGEIIDDHPNVKRLLQSSRELVARLAQRLREGARPQEPDLRIYEDLVIFVLYHQFRPALNSAIDGLTHSGSSRTGLYDDFTRAAAEFLSMPGLQPPLRDELPHLLACFYQIKRAFRHIFRYVIGVSEPTWRFRAAVWESIFSHDMRRYRRVLYDRMADMVTIITGPSGTGKELAARAIGLSLYLPLDPATQRFTEDKAHSFAAINLAALSPTLIESELFGHRRGAFTGAIGDHAGWLEVCPPRGTVFLDEIGELDPAIQVKLLRVLQTRTFQRIGDTQDRAFHGKIVAATNRDLALAMHTGRIRPDFYYRLCSDIIVVPSLRERLDAHPDELRTLILFIANRLVPGESDSLASETTEFIEQRLAPDYPWPGNVRELEQCVRNVLIRRSYRAAATPAEPSEADDAPGQLAALMKRGALTAEQVLCQYCAIVYAQAGSYEEAARRIGLDRRTVKSKVLKAAAGN